MSLLMMKRAGIIGITVFFSLFSLPNFLPDFCVPEFLMFSKVKLGLDLKGGSSILFEVDEAEVISSNSADVLAKIRSSLRKNHIKFKSIKSKDGYISLILIDMDRKNELDKIIQSIDQDMFVKESEGDVFKIYFSDQYVAQILRAAVSRSIEVLDKRVNEFGTNETIIQSYGSNRILLQIPGVFDTNQVKDVLGKTAKLSLYLVKQVVDTKEDVMQFSNVLILRGDSDGEWYVLEKECILSGEHLVNAQVSFGQYQEPMVSFTFDAVGARLFAEITSRNIGRRLAIVLDDKVLSAPSINTPIIGGSGVIQGRFTAQEAANLALMMRSGALPAKLNVLEERIIGPGLGEASIKAGTLATILSVIAIILFVFLIYHAFGVFANIALFANLLLMVAFLSIFGITLTLPGIAGIALTLGMAVDANILINERIREELSNGMKVMQAVHAGYQRAMRTIFDANFTTIIGSIFLCIFGSGPIRGFGITLIIGILISIFTSIVLSRTLTVIWLEKRRPSQLNF